MNHQRERWFLLAHSNSEDVSNSDGQRLQRQRRKESTIDGSSQSSWWAVEPPVGRVAHGVPRRVDRIKCLGNAVVPEQAKEAFERLMGI